MAKMGGTLIVFFYCVFSLITSLMASLLGMPGDGVIDFETGRNI